MVLLDELLLRIARHDEKHKEAIDAWTEKRETPKNTNDRIKSLAVEIEAELNVLILPIYSGQTSGDDLVDYVIRRKLKIPNRDIVAACKGLVNFRTALESRKGYYITYTEQGIRKQMYMAGIINVNPTIIVERNNLSINTNGYYARYDSVDYDYNTQLCNKNMPLLTDRLDDYLPTKTGNNIKHLAWQSLINCLNKAK